MDVVDEPCEGFLGGLSDLPVPFVDILPDSDIVIREGLDKARHGVNGENSCNACCHDTSWKVELEAQSTEMHANNYEDDHGPR